MLEIDLTGRKAFVTGGGRGIGAGVCRALAAGGADVGFTYLQDTKSATELVGDLTGRGARALAVQADAVNVEAMDRAVAKAAGFLGGIDILVANAGYSWSATLADLSVEDWKRGMDLNLDSAYIAIKSVYPRLQEAERGDILLIGASSVYDGGGGSPYYAAAKAGMVGLMRYLMRELPGQNIRVNTIHPCVVDTDLLREYYDTPEKIETVRAQVPLGRLSTPADIGNLIAFLCSELGGFICGQSILVDGGRTFWRK